MRILWLLTPGLFYCIVPHVVGMLAIILKYLKYKESKILTVSQNIEKL